MNPSPYIHCRYCPWKTLRFRGKKRGEPALRNHVVDEHEAEYLASQELAGEAEDRPYYIDELEIGEQPL